MMAMDFLVCAESCFMAYLRRTAAPMKTPAATHSATAARPTNRQTTTDTGPAAAVRPN